MNPFRRLRGPARAYGARHVLRNLAVAVTLLVGLTGGAVAEVRVLAFGDSLTAGYGLPEGQGFVPQLQRWLRRHGAPDVTVLNGGVSGDTSAGGLARIDWALGQDVDAVIVELGANDLLRGIDPAVTQKNLDGILTAIDRKGIPALIAGVPAPPNYGPEYREAFHGMFRGLAESHGAIYYRSFLAGMGQGRSVRQVMRLMQGDGLHPNAQGVQAIVAHIGPSVLQLVEEARRR